MSDNDSIKIRHELEPTPEEEEKVQKIPCRHKTSEHNQACLSLNKKYFKSTLFEFDPKPSIKKRLEDYDKVNSAELRKIGGNSKKPQTLANKYRESKMMKIINTPQE